MNILIHMIKIKIIKIINIIKIFNKIFLKNISPNKYIHIIRLMINKKNQYILFQLRITKIKINNKAMNINNIHKSRTDKILHRM